MDKEHKIGDVIALLRKDKGLTQEQVADILCVSKKAISKWESNAGNPSIEFLPKLAEVLDTSISYLLTGNKEEIRYIITPIEKLCAMKDDVSLINDVFNQDRKSFIDYIKEYESLKVFVQLCEQNKDKGFHFLDRIKFCILSNRIDLLTSEMLKLKDGVRFAFEDGFFDLWPIAEKDNFNSIYEQNLCVLPNDFFEMLVCDKRILPETLEKLISDKDKSGCLWYMGYPYLIHYAYINGKFELLSKLIENAITNNNKGFEKFIDEYPRKRHLRNFALIGEYGKCEYGFVRILESTLKLAIENSDIEYIEKFNNINNQLKNYKDCNVYIASDYEVKMAKLKIDETITREEYLTESLLHDGVVCVEELIALRDLDLVKKILKKYPIDKDEYKYKEIAELYVALEKNDYKTIRNYAVENKKYDLEEACDEEEEKEIFVKRELDKLNRLEINHNDNYYSRRKIIYCTEKYKEICEKKEQIITNLHLSLLKEKSTKGLNKTFFENELKKENLEIVIIKLYKKIEAIFKYDYKYEGTFAEMLDKYISEQLTWQEDDGWGYPETAKDYKTISALQALKDMRNNIVHSEQTDTEMTTEDIKHCIEHICKFDEK